MQIWLIDAFSQRALPKEMAPAPSAHGWFEAVDKRQYDRLRKDYYDLHGCYIAMRKSRNYFAISAAAFFLTSALYLGSYLYVIGFKL